jgi:hypothetical protein
MSGDGGIVPLFWVSILNIEPNFKVTNGEEITTDHNLAVFLYSASSLHRDAKILPQP